MAVGLKKQQEAVVAFTNLASANILLKILMFQFYSDLEFVLSLTLSCALQASSCTQKEDKDCKYQKKSLAGGLVCKL